MVLLVIAASFGWSQVRVIQLGEQQVALAPSWTWGVMLLAFIVALIGAVAPKAAAITSILYALLQGTMLGIVSAFYNLEFEGIVLQAVLLTVSIFFAMLLLYTIGIIKVTSGFVMGVVGAMSGLLLLYVVAWLLSLFGVNFAFLYAPTPLGIGLAFLIVILAALNLPLDFAFIQRAAAAKAPKFLEWYGAFGLMLSIIWMYVSLLRLLALLRMSRR
jgi:uncharacterized YccA/Bax inhibitor family protein